MSPKLLLYGATGFVGVAIARLAVERGLRPILGGRNAQRLEPLASSLGLEYRAFPLDDTTLVDGAFDGISVVLHCAGPFVHTFRPIADACLRRGAHYLDITGEIPVYQGLAELDQEARKRGVMLLPGVGFDVVPTDCLAQYLKRRLPSAKRLVLAFQVRGPAGLPPGTANTMVEMLPYGVMVCTQGRLAPAPDPGKTRTIDFGTGPVKASLLSWGDIFMAYRSTGIPEIEDYAVLPPPVAALLKTVPYARALFANETVQAMLKRLFRMQAGSTAEQRARTSTHVWGLVEDDEGRSASARLHGPEAGVVWTELTALAAVQRVLSGDAPPGFQTPSLAYGPDFVMSCAGVTREDLWLHPD